MKLFSCPNCYTSEQNGQARDCIAAIERDGRHRRSLSPAHTAGVCPMVISGKEPVAVRGDRGSVRPCADGAGLGPVAGELTLRRSERPWPSTPAEGKQSP